MLSAPKDRSVKNGWRRRESGPRPAGTRAGPSDALLGERARAASLTFDEVYEGWFHEVSRWVRAMGAPDADREDLVQEVFVIVHRRLGDFDGRNLAGWLYRIAQRRVRDFRRLNWFRHFVLRGAPLSDRLVAMAPGPVETMETTEKEQLLARLLGSLNESERAALILFEVEGYKGQDIAHVQSVPLNTVWARIAKARKKLQARLAKFQAAERRKVGS